MSNNLRSANVIFSNPDNIRYLKNPKGYNFSRIFSPNFL